MKTNEKKRIEADRRIPLNNIDILYELLGNLSGDIQSFYLDEKTKILYIYHNDNGFSNEDRKAYITKNESGQKYNTASINGIGEILAIDRLLKENARANIYSFNNDINENYKCSIGNFDYFNWVIINKEEINEKFNFIIKKMCNNNKNIGKTGTLKEIPLDDKFIGEFIKNNKLLNACLKYLNIKINNGTTFYWQNEKKHINKLCPDNKSITIKYSIGYDTSNTNLSENHKLSLILKIDNYDDIKSSVKKRFNCNIAKNISFNKLNKKSLENEYKYAKTFSKMESGLMKLNIINDDNDDNDNIFSVEVLDGIQLYLNELNLNYKSLKKELGGRNSAGAFGKDIYNGKPRFEIHIDKNTKLYFLPSDKTNIKETSKGELIHKFIKILTTFNINLPTQPIPPPPIPSPLKDNISWKRKTHVFHRWGEGKSIIECACCFRKLYPFKPNELQMGHIISEKNGGTIDFNNLVPCCEACNKQMGTQNLKQYIKNKYPKNFDDFNEKYKKYIDPNNIFKLDEKSLC